MMRGREGLRGRGPSGATVSPRGQKTGSPIRLTAIFSLEPPKRRLQEPSVLAALPSTGLNCLPGPSRGGRVSGSGD